MSAFTDVLNLGNTALGAVCGEEFELLARGGQTSTPGTYTAVSIDNMDIDESVISGGILAENVVTVHVSNVVMAASGITDNDKLLVRGERVRVDKILDDGDNQKSLVCATAGVKL